MTLLYPLLYTWAALYAFYFFSMREALAHLAFIGVSYAVVLAIQDAPGRCAGCSASARPRWPGC